jgi:signal peptidase II
MASSPTSGRRGGAGLGGGTHRVLFATVAIGWLVADQLSKTWAEDALAADNIIDVVGSLRFNLAYNTGASFGIGGGLGSWISVVALAVVGLLVWQGRSVGSRLAAVAIGMIVGGALGNVIDRAFRGDEGFMSGAVVDFIDVQWWPIFNIADIGIVVGGLLLVVATFRTSEPDAGEPIGSSDGDEPTNPDDRPSPTS